MTELEGADQGGSGILGEHKFHNGNNMAQIGDIVTRVNLEQNECKCTKLDTSHDSAEVPESMHDSNNGEIVGKEPHGMIGMHSNSEEVVTSKVVYSNGELVGKLMVLVATVTL